ncbi:MAG: tetratricopeptide repeat protein [Gammaproteobacteria bacterium]|nr:tetratricopeptide repeat protein [Gammaproteobacteria bacterium]
MSLLLDALKKAAQEKLDKEKKDQQPNFAAGNEKENVASDSNQTVSDYTQIDTDSLPKADTPPSDATEIDATTLAAPVTDRTEIDATSMAESPSNVTEYDVGIEVTGLPNDVEALDKTQIEMSEPLAKAEKELELEPSLTDLSIDADAFGEHSDSLYSRDTSDRAETDLYAFDRKDITGLQARGERTTDYDLDATKQDKTDQSRTYSSSLTENLQAEHQQYYAGSPERAAQVFSSKSPDGDNRVRLYFLSGLVVIALLILGSLYAVDYVANLNQNQIVTPISRSRLDEPLSAALTRNQPQFAAQAEVDPALLIEQEDYSELLQDTLTGYEEKPAISGKPATSKAAPASTTASTRQTVAGRSGEYTISRSKPRGEALRTILLRGYDAYQAGELENAEIAYRQALTRAPRNRDALLGMAAVNVARQETESAQIYYNKLLELNPRDDLALAGIAGLGQQTGDIEAEISRLKLMLAEKPDSAHLNFTLGNLYANQSRWAEAQQAYFDSARLDEKNPDYIFNLAVSLEHLGQPKAALGFYQRALALSNNKHSHFDTALALSRVNELSAR